MIPLDTTFDNALTAELEFPKFQGQDEATEDCLKSIAEYLLADIRLAARVTKAGCFAKIGIRSNEGMN